MKTKEKIKKIKEELKRLKNYQNNGGFVTSLIIKEQIMKDILKKLEFEVEKENKCYTQTKI